MLGVGLGLVGLYVVFNAGKASALGPTGLPVGGVPSSGTVAGSSIGTGTSSIPKGTAFGLQTLTGSSKPTLGSAGQGLLGTVVLGPSYEVYNAGKTILGWL